MAYAVWPVVLYLYSLFFEVITSRYLNRMQSDRPVMNVNEDSEILSKLGILSSELESPHKYSPKKNTSEEAKYDDWKWEGGPEAGDSSNDESDSDAVYDKHTLLSGRLQSRGVRRSRNGFTCRKVLLACSFISLGLSTSILGSTLPDLGAVTGTKDVISLSHVISFNAVGYFFGNVLFSRLFTRINPLVLLLFCVIGAVPFTVIIAWCNSFQFINFYSCILGIFLGSIHRGGLIVLYGIDGKTGAVFGIHVALAFGAFVAPLCSAPFVLNSVRSITVVSSESTPLKTNVFKREATPQPPLQLYNSPAAWSETATEVASPIRPESAVGDASDIKTKAMENEVMRKKVEKMKQEKEIKDTVAANCSALANGSNCLDATPNLSTNSSSNDTLRSSSASLSTVFPLKTNTSVKATEALFTTVTVSAEKIMASPMPSTERKVPSADLNMESDKNKNFTRSLSITEGITVVFANTTNVIKSPDESVMWKTVNDKVAELNSTKLTYVVIGILCLFCAGPFVFSFACCCEELSVVPDLQIAKLRAAPDSVSNETTENSSIRWWRWYASLLFLVLAGIEIFFGSFLVIYTLDFVYLSQLTGVLVTSAFWAGVLVARIFCALCVKSTSSIRTAQFLLFTSTVVSGSAAFFTPATPLILCAEVFILGSLLSSVSLWVLIWLDAQLSVSRLLLTMLYGAAVSTGRCIVPLIGAFFMFKYHYSASFFTVICFLFAIAFAGLLLLNRCVRSIARLNALNQLTDAVTSSSRGASKMETAISFGIKDNKRNGRYMQLVENEDPDMVLISSDEEKEEDEL